MAKTTLSLLKRLGTLALVVERVYPRFKASVAYFDVTSMCRHLLTRKIGISHLLEPIEVFGVWICMVVIGRDIVDG